MKIGFIGAGKVGKSFGKYIKEKGIEVVGYYSRSYDSAKEAAEYTNSKAYSSMEDLVPLCTMIFITTTDDMIEPVSHEICEKKVLKKGQKLVHMSGASSSLILKSAKKYGCHIYSLHPLQAFADIHKAVEDLKNTPFSIEGDEEGIHDVVEIMNKCGNKYFLINAEDKPLYHGAACVVSNYLVTLMDIGLELFYQAGINKKDGFNALYPLINGSLENIKNMGTEHALTGPVSRGDINTLKNHLKAMEEKTPHLLEIYKAMGRVTTKLASKKKLRDETKIEILNTLWKEGK